MNLIDNFKTCFQILQKFLMLTEDEQRFCEPFTQKNGCATVIQEIIKHNLPAFKPGVQVISLN